MVSKKILKDKKQSVKPKILFLVGPTAIGKSALSIKAAKRLKAEIVVCDSMQVYKGMDILSCSPDKDMAGIIPHHLFSELSPEKEFNASLYRKLALRKINEIHKRNRIPLFVGGSGLYMSVVIDGIFKGATKDEMLRKKLYKEAQLKGRNVLYERLKKADPQAAFKIHPHDLKRIIRALEVYYLSGKPISKLQQQRKGLGRKFDIKIFCLYKALPDLYYNINERVEQMFAAGLLDEVKRLLTLKNLSLTCAQAIGIKEIRGFLDGQYDIEQAKEQIKKNTRNYARRQMAWFRKDKRIIWVEADKPGTLAEILKKI